MIPLTKIVSQFLEKICQPSLKELKKIILIISSKNAQNESTDAQCILTMKKIARIGFSLTQLILRTDA